MAIQLSERDFESGSLQVTSYGRPGKLFTANAAIIVSVVGHLKQESLSRLLAEIVNILQGWSSLIGTSSPTSEFEVRADGG